MRDYIAKSDGTTLRKHSMEVCDMAISILNVIGINDEVFRKAVMIGAIVHDIGKTSRIFQEYISSNNDIENLPDDDIPRHNELSGALLKILTEESSICNDDLIRTVLIEAVSYHHNPFLKEPKSLWDYYTNDEIVDICDYYNQIFRAYNLEKDIVLSSSNIDNCEYDGMVGGKDTLSFITDDRQRNKRATSKFDIIFNILRQADLIVSEGGRYDMNRPHSDITADDMVCPERFEKTRWHEQVDIAERLYSRQIAILDAPMGYGKTLVAISTLLKSDKVGYYITTDNTLGYSTYIKSRQLLDDCGLNDISLGLVLEGEWKYGKEGECDIIITNIDTWLNGTFRNSRKRISYESACLNCVIDEFHEYMYTEAAMSALFVSRIMARKMMKNAKTVLISGTPNYSFVGLTADDVLKTSTPINGMLDKIVKIKFINSSEIPETVKDKKDILVIWSSVDNCQNAFVDGGYDLCFHSRFDDNDEKRITHLIFETNGEFAGEMRGSRISSTSIMSRGIDCSFDNVILVNPSPIMIEQVTGRMNRWGLSNEDVELFIVIDNKAVGLYRTSGDTFNTPLWKDVYRPYIYRLKERYEEKGEITVNELKVERESFLSERHNSKYNMILHNTIDKGFASLRTIPFRKGQKLSYGPSIDKRVNDNPDVRGNTLNRFVKIRKDGTSINEYNFSGVMALPYYAFGKNGFDELNNKDNLIETCDYLISFPDEAEKYNFSIEKVKRIRKSLEKGGNSNRLFEVFKNLAKSSETPFPILYGYGYNSTIGFRKKKNN